ncbi:RNA polymerase sigma factor [Actinacidiphila yeochonensis]|uniref:RNA polymerase sigma factor n=1 Tax=Actinacidiphila yeochonensis TaxID=89050 RepID=UPI00055DF57B|nr:RNA polymerase sigma factor [Actinacidiphila yeochonensis]
MRDTDNETRRRVREGDREAFAQLYEQFARAVYNHGLRLTGDWSTAEEVMSETFLAAWQARARVQEDGGTLLPWLLGIATHKADNARRGFRRRQGFLARQPQPDVQEDFAPETAGRIDDARRLRAVHAALCRLRRQEREVLALCVWGGLDYQQTAEALGIAVGTVRSRLSRARGRLAALAEEGMERPGARGEMTGEAAIAALTVGEKPA